MTKSDFSFHEPKRVVINFIWSAGAIFLMWLLGLTEPLEENLNLLWLLLVVFACLFPLDFVWNALATPRLLQQEADKYIEELLLALDNREKQNRAMVQLWKLRKEGVKHRNMHVTSIDQYQLWHKEYEKWRTKVLREAGKISPNFRGWLEVLERMDAAPIVKTPPLHDDHHRFRCIMTEIMVRMEEFLKTAMFKRDI